MPNLCIRLPEQICKNARVWAALHDTTVTEAVRLFLDRLPHYSTTRIGAASARSAAGRAQTPSAPARAVVSLHPLVTRRFSNEDPAPTRRPAS
jgi:hypothetical protein